MPRLVRCGLTQATNALAPDGDNLRQVREAMIAKHLRLIEAAAQQGVQILCLQELFYGPYF
ncbi:MAG TPA: acyltransferase, partial [Vicinamibacteria bacterium]